MMTRIQTWFYNNKLQINVFTQLIKLRLNEEICGSCVRSIELQKVMFIGFLMQKN